MEPNANSPMDEAANLFATPTVGSNSSYPSEMNNTSNPGSAPQMPYTIGSGVTRGTQIIANPDGTQIVLGQIGTTNQYGIALLDTSGNVVQKLIGGTTYTYDAKNNYVNSFISGILPDGTSGFVAAKPGIDASTLFS